MGLTLVIVFGGHQLISSLPASHSASPFHLHRADRKRIHRCFVVNRCVPLRADVCCCLGPCSFGIPVSVNLSGDGGKRAHREYTVYLGLPNTT